MDLLIQVVGLGLVLLALVDIYLTVLFPRLGSSVLSFMLARSLWCLFRTVAGIMPAQRARLLAHSGSLTVTTIVVAWIALLIGGFTCLNWVGLGTGIQASEGPTPRDFWTALYYSGYAVTTLGTGDLLPKTDYYRMLMVLQSALGFATFTLTITYVLSIYAALTQRNTLALSLHHRSNDTADPIELLIRLLPDGSPINIHQSLSDMAKDLMYLVEAQHSYPILLYFRFSQTYYALPRIILLLMETATLIKSALHPEKYRFIINSAAVAEVWRGGLQLSAELSDLLFPKLHPRKYPHLEQVWRKQFYQALERLSAEGIETVPNPEVAADRYVDLRRKWFSQLTILAEHMAYRSSEIAPTESSTPGSISAGER